MYSNEYNSIRIMEKSNLNKSKKSHKAMKIKNSKIEK